MKHSHKSAVAFVARHAVLSAHAGPRQVDDSAAADLWLVNTCTVKSPSQSQMDTCIAKGKREGKALLISGTPRSRPASHLTPPPSRRRRRRRRRRVCAAG